MKKTIILIALVVTSTQLKAADVAEATTSGSGDAFLQLSLTPAIALHSKDTTVRGVSLNIWGENPHHGLILGIVNGSTGESGGLSWGPFNYTESYTGVQLGFMNFSSASFTGWQSAMFNYAEGTFTGVQTGVVNSAENCRGLQLGAINCAENLNGMQIGFFNVVVNNGWFVEFPDKLAMVFPFVNWSF